MHPPPTPEERVLRNADIAHRRLLMDADASLALRGTTHDALHKLAVRRCSADVPQIRTALAELREREREVVAAPATPDRPTTPGDEPRRSRPLKRSPMQPELNG